MLVWNSTSITLHRVGPRGHATRGERDPFSHGSARSCVLHLRLPPHGVRVRVREVESVEES
jgi:hypothetical protein